MGSDLEQWKRCLVKSIQLFCRNFCQYDQEAKIDGLLAITLDRKEVILVKLQEVDNDSSAQRMTPGKPMNDQSEILESILRYLAPSCRLLKKTAIAPRLPSVWQPVGDPPRATTDVPDRLTFLRSLGLAPTALVASQVAAAAESSCKMRLRSKVGLTVHASMPDFGRPADSPRTIESLTDIGSSQPAASPCPSRVVVPPSSDGDSLRSGDEPSPGSSAKRHGEGTLELVTQPVSDDRLVNAKPLSIVCEKNGTKTATNHRHNEVKSSVQQSSAHVTNCVTNERISRDKKPVSSVSHSQHTDACSGCDAKPLPRPKKRSADHQALSGSGGPPAAKLSPNDVGAKRAKSDSNDDSKAVEVKDVKSESISSSSADPAKPVTSKKSSKPKEKSCKLTKNTDVTASTSTSSKPKTASVMPSKSVSTKKVVTPVAKNETKTAGKLLVNKSKARLKVLYTKTANIRKDRMLKVLHKVRQSGCGTCPACKVKDDCRTCKFCLDMKRYGGPNKLRKKCRLRQCRSIQHQQKKARSLTNQTKAQTTD